MLTNASDRSGTLVTQQGGLPFRGHDPRAHVGCRLCTAKRQALEEAMIYQVDQKSGKLSTQV
jgi:hypothetical protein